MKLPFGPSSRSVHTGLSLSAPTLRAPRSILQRRALRPSPPDPPREPTLQRGTRGTHPASPGVMKSSHHVRGKLSLPFSFGERIEWDEKTRKRLSHCVHRGERLSFAS